MKLIEVAQSTQQSPNISKIEKWLDDNRIKNYKVRRDGIVDVNGDVNLRSLDSSILPVQFGNVLGDFNCSWANLSSLAGSPRYVKGEFDCHNTKISTLEGGPQQVDGDFECWCCYDLVSFKGAPQIIDGRFGGHATGVKSLSGINKMIKQINKGFSCTDGATHILGLLLIPGITVIEVTAGPIDDIMNKYLPTHNVILAQDELIDAGFIEQAKL